MRDLSSALLTEDISDVLFYFSVSRSHAMHEKLHPGTAFQVTCRLDGSHPWNVHPTTTGDGSLRYFEVLYFFQRREQQLFAMSSELRG